MVRPRPFIWTHGGKYLGVTFLFGQIDEGSVHVSPIFGREGVTFEHQSHGNVGSQVAFGSDVRPNDEVIGEVGEFVAH